jgi:hypothetical protein
MSELVATSGLDLLITQLDGRAQRLRRQAHIFLTIIILVLIAGGVAFVYANKIVALGQSHSAAAEYATVEAAFKTLDQRAEEINKAALYDADDQVVKECNGVTFKRNRDDLGHNPSPQPARDRVGEYVVQFPMRDVHFANLQDGVDCGQKLASAVPRSIDELRQQINKVISDRDLRTNQLKASKAREIEVYNKQLQEINNERDQLQPVRVETSKRAMEERVLGAPIELGNHLQPTEKSGLTDWAQIIQSNLTRIASLGIMFFLVAILVPQYRYNIRIATFYDARADSMRLAGKLPAITHIDDLEKTILAMTPSIDFGKAPTTPIDQLVELIKAAKG